MPLVSVLTLNPPPGLLLKSPTPHGKGKLRKATGERNWSQLVTRTFFQSGSCPDLGTGNKQITCPGAQRISLEAGLGQALRAQNVSWHPLSGSCLASCESESGHLSTVCTVLAHARPGPPWGGGGHLSEDQRAFWATGSKWAVEPHRSGFNPGSSH